MTEHTVATFELYLDITLQPKIMNEN